MFCRYCGRQIPDGEICPCQKKQNPGTSGNPKMRPAAKKPEMMRGQRPPEQKQPRQAPPKQKLPKQKPVKQKPMKQKPMKQKPPIQPSMMPDGRLLAVLSFVLAVAAIALFVVLRFVFADNIPSDSVIGMIYPYLIYIVPITLGVIGCLFGVFSLQDKRIRTLSIAGIAVCALLSAGMLGSMFVFPYEPDSSYVSDDEEDEEENKDDKGKDKKDKDNLDEDEEGNGKSKGEKDAKDSAVGKIKKSYEDGKLDYAGVKKELNDLDTEDLSDDEEEELMTLQEDIEADLVTDIEDLVKDSDYEGAFEKLNKIVEELEEDELAESLLDKYEAEYIMYLAEESEKLAGEGKKEEAVKMLTAAAGLVDDTTAVEDILKDVESGTIGGDYIIADSNSRLLTDADVKDLTLQQINYAKNEIYARHGRQFASKELQDYFNGKSWYNGTVPAGSFSESVFNTYEKKNAEFLSKVEFSIDSAGYKLDVN